MEKFSSRNLESFGGKQLPLYLMLALLSACGECQDVETVGEKWNLEESFDMGFDQGRDLGSKADMGNDADMGVDLGDEDMGGVIDMDLEVDMGDKVKLVKGEIVDKTFTQILGDVEKFELKLNSGDGCDLIGLNIFGKEGYESEFEANVKNIVLESDSMDLEFEKDEDGVFSLYFDERKPVIDLKQNFRIEENIFGKDEAGVEVPFNLLFEVKPELSDNCIMDDNLFSTLSNRLVELSVSQDDAEYNYGIIRSGVRVLGVLSLDAFNGYNLDSQTGELLDTKIVSIDFKIELSDNVKVHEVYLEELDEYLRYDPSINEEMLGLYGFEFEYGNIIRSGNFKFYVLKAYVEVEEPFEGTAMKVSVDELVYTTNDTNGTYQYVFKNSIVIRDTVE
jgi:hypothetical protein